MSENITKRDFLVKIAKMYYLENKSQQQIAHFFDISRSNVSKLLTKCRELKIVEIHINDVSSMGVCLQEKIRKFFNLDTVCVVPTEIKRENTQEKIGQIAGDLLDEVICDNQVIGITRGITLSKLVHEFQPQKSTVGNEVVQLVGSFGEMGIGGEGMDVPLSLAKKLKAPCNLIQAPPMVGSVKLKEMLCKEPQIMSILEKAQKVDVAILGIGGTSVIDSSYYRGGFVTEEELKREQDLGVIGEIGGKLINIKGEGTSSLNQRIIGINLEDLKQIKIKFGLAEGKGKALAVLGSLRGGYLSHLIIDEELAVELVNLEKRIEETE